ncbi:Abi family protein [Brevibacterium album]|uniref:Abi family protein n=1 Tax=Brevibacterium album TaxID=417948 RepID=UPI00048F81B4|nr:Abi family protein [Brevibacterium album]
MKPSLAVQEQVSLLTQRGLTIADPEGCTQFLRSTNYYRFSGYARYFQRAPHLGDNTFEPTASFEGIRRIYDDDEALRATLTKPLAHAELILRTHVARTIADDHGAYIGYLERDFYTDVGDAEPTVEACLRDIDRSQERHILRYRTPRDDTPRYAELPVWSAVEAWSFGTLSKVIERGAQGSLADAVASSIGVARAGFAYRVRALVYLRNRCAHHSRLWHHSVIDAGPTPNNVRVKAKRLAGQFEPRSVLDVVASLSDVLVRGNGSLPVLPDIVQQHRQHEAFWEGLGHPISPRDRQE